MITAYRVLYIDDTAASRKAAEALRKAELEFVSAELSDPEEEGVVPPSLMTSDGSFPSLEDILWYAERYGRNGGGHSEHGRRVQP
jgi:hypothetical protein